MPGIRPIELHHRLTESSEPALSALTLASGEANSEARKAVRLRSDSSAQEAEAELMAVEVAPAVVVPAGAV